MRLAATALLLLSLPLSLLLLLLLTRTTTPPHAPPVPAEFAMHNLWVTPHADSERWPAGDYTILSPGGKGLPEWTAKNRPVRDADCVVWHAFGVSGVW